MSSDVAVLGKDCTFSIDATGMQEILGIRTLTYSEPGADDVEKIDVTSHSSASMLREKIDGFSSLVTGTVSLDMVWDQGDTYHALLLTNYEDGTAGDFELVLKTKGADKTGTFSGQVSNVEVSVPVDDAVTATVEITIDSSGISWV